MPMSQQPADDPRRRCRRGRWSARGGRSATPGTRPRRSPGRGSRRRRSPRGPAAGATAGPPPGRSPAAGLTCDCATPGTADLDRVFQRRQAAPPCRRRRPARAGRRRSSSSCRCPPGPAQHDRAGGLAEQPARGSPRPRRAGPGRRGRRYRPEAANRRTTAFSPWSVGNVLTRISTSPGRLADAGPPGARRCGRSAGRPAPSAARRRSAPTAAGNSRGPVQHAVDPPADVEPLGRRLEVDVARAHARAPRPARGRRPRSRTRRAPGDQSPQLAPQFLARQR